MPTPPPAPPAPGTGPAPAAQPEARTGMNPVLKWGLIGCGGLLTLMIVGVIALIAIGVKVADEVDTLRTNTISIAPAGVGMPKITDQVDPETNEPLSAFGYEVPSNLEVIYASAPVNVKAGQVVMAKWYYNDEHVPNLDTPFTYTEDTIGWFAPYLTMNGNPFPEGTYKVEMYLDGEPKTGKEFKVVK